MFKTFENYLALEPGGTWGEKFIFMTYTANCDTHRLIHKFQAIKERNYPPVVTKAIPPNLKQSEALCVSVRR